MGLKTVVQRLKKLEHTTGISERRRNRQDFHEHILYICRVNPLFIQETFWGLVELTHDEITAIGRQERTLESFQDRFKMDMPRWFRVGKNYDPPLRQIAQFNISNCDPYPDWWLKK